jgi:hypothetical protein
MEQHGLKVAYYPVNAKLVTPLSDLVSAIKEHQPKILVIFHPAGITNTLMKEVKAWQKYLALETIIIEDCVHKILDERKVKFVSERHFLIDSLRKVVPIQGSNVYSLVPVPEINIWQSWLTFPYRLSVLYYWITMQIWLFCSYSTRKEKWWRKVEKKANLALTKGYDLIGSNKLASPGLAIMNYLYPRIPIKKIEECKEWQAKMYTKALKPFLNSPDFWVPTMKRSDYKYLRGFPIVINLKVAEDFLVYLRDNGVFIDFGLDDGPWSKNQKIIYLPMGLHIKKDEIQNIINIIF